MTARTGHCLCGAVSFSYQGPENWIGHCHCESCRRATSAPFTTFVGVPRSAVEFTGAARKTYRSSPGVRRSFCGTCGSPIAYESDRWSEEIHFYACCLTDPAAVAPQFHVHTGQQLPWVDLADSLPRYTGNSAS